MLVIRVKRLDPEKPPGWVGFVREELNKGGEVLAEPSLLDLLREMEIEAKPLDKNLWRELGDRTAIVPYNFDPYQRDIFDYVQIQFR